MCNRCTGNNNLEKKDQIKSNIENYLLIKNQSIDRSIKEDPKLTGEEMNTEIKWWKGLGKDLEIDIESFDEE